MTAPEKTEAERLHTASLARAREVFRVQEALRVLRESGVDEDTVHRIEQGCSYATMINDVVHMIYGAADKSAARNYVAVNMTGLVPPFDRVYVELVRVGAKTSHDMREYLTNVVRMARTMAKDGSSQAVLLDAAIEEVSP